MLVQSAIGATQGHLCLLQRPLVRSVMRGAMRVRAARLGADLEMGRALGLQWDLVRRRVQSVMLHAMRLRLALVGLTALEVVTAQVDLTAPVVQGHRCLLQ